MSKYEPKKIELKWQKFWADNQTFKTKDDSDKNYYALDMFPYPSGAGLHVGHPKGYIATDILARQKMMQGYNVLHPMGWDAFGLPAENYAIKNKVHPAKAVEKNIVTFKKQLGSLGFTYDWSREVNTTDPNYYKWAQWAFIQMFKKGLVYESHEPINWCPSCQTGLANEDLKEGKCERCDSEIERKPMRQWAIKITEYADRLLDDLEKLNKWPEHIKLMQKDWIGRSGGTLVDFKIKDSEEILQVFTTRPDTLFGSTYMVVAPEHELVKNYISKEVEDYIKQAKKKSDLERAELQKDKTGVELKGVKAINPVNGQEIPVWVADYVLMSYGTGAIMAVPGHDQRDYEFAKKFDLEIKCVIDPGPVRLVGDRPEDDSQMILEEIYSGKRCYEGEGKIINSDFIDGLNVTKAKAKITKWLEEKKIGKPEINYKLRDWVFSRQRYWGEPIPLVKCGKCAKEKTQFLIIHGIHGSSQENWFPWFKQELESKGHEVLIPDFPDSSSTNIDEWLGVLGGIKNKLKENLVIIAHSMGGPVACKFIEQENLKVKKLILVAPTGKNQKRELLKKIPLKDDDIDCIFRFNDTRIDLSKVKELVDKKVLYFSDDDPYIPLDVQKNYKELGGKVKIFKNMGHFNENITGMTEFPDILTEFNNLNSGWHVVSEKDLPLKLPDVKNYEPSGTGESPLANISEWVNTICPKCGGEAKRETNTMPQWAGSSWYYLRYLDPNNDKALVDKNKEKNWSPIDMYVGGAEHATRHLIYARFWHKFLFDVGAVNYEEPFTGLQNVGLILAEDGRKMSKRWGNVINPDDVVEEYGADAMRVYEMFMGPFNQPCAWNTKGLVGAKRFLDRVWNLQDKVVQDGSEKELESLFHQTIKKVTEDIGKMHYNTAISALMTFVNELYKHDEVYQTEYSTLIKLLSPFAPHMCEELWQILGNKESITKSSWPKYDESKIVEETITLAIQVNGKLRDTLEVASDISEEDAKKLALDSDKIKKWLDGKEPKKVIYVKGKLVSIVV